MNPLSSGNVEQALAKIGDDSLLRREMVDFLRRMEEEHSFEKINVREEITGPLVDILYQNSDVTCKVLSSGIKICFRYQSKIARDFIMAGDRPECVWEPQTTKLLLSLGTNAKAIIIGGAYFGDQAIIVADAIKSSGGMCHCFEVSSEEMKMLKLNASNNNLNNLEFNQLALWDEDRKYLTLVGSDSHASCREIEEKDSGETFTTITIDSYGREKKLERIDLIMLDIEGGEFVALKGAENYLKKPVIEAPNLIFEIHRHYVDWSNGLENTEIIKFLKGFGYHFFGIRDYQGNVPMEGRPVELVPIKGMYLEGPPHGFNVLAVKDKSIIDKHNLKICPGVSPKLLFHRDPKLHQPLN